MNAARFVTGYFAHLQAGAVRTYPDKSLDFEAIGIDPESIKAVCPDRKIAVRHVGIVRPKKQADEEADAAVSETAKSRDVARSSALAESAAFGIVGAFEQSITKYTDYGTVHRSVSVKSNEDVALRRVQPGLERRALSGLGFVDNKYVWSENFGDSLGIVIRAAVDDNYFMHPTRNGI
ncbi:MAG: hypothetical protein WAK12_01375 [Acidimicrobiales bacterium]